MFYALFHGNMTVIILAFMVQLICITILRKIKLVEVLQGDYLFMRKIFGVDRFPDMEPANYFLESGWQLLAYTFFLPL